jgi:hypothetical protein
MKIEFWFVATNKVFIYFEAYKGMVELGYILIVGWELSIIVNDCKQWAVL